MTHYGASHVTRFTGSTHDESAFISKDPATVERLNRHLAAKIEMHRGEIESAIADLQPGADTLWLSFGITAGSMREAVQAARKRGQRVSSLVLHSLWPVPETTIERALDGIRVVVVAELNQGQYRRELESLADGQRVVGLNRVDGELITPAQFLETLG